MPNEKSISDNVPKQKFVRRLGQAFIERLVQDPWSGSTIAALAAPQAQPAVSPGVCMQTIPIAQYLALVP
jgi:hypothetical protein